MDFEFGLKELYDCKIKATYPIEVGAKTFEPGEVLASFEKIQIANFKEISDYVAARGGFDNRGHVFWDTTKEVRISFTQGIFSRDQLALLVNARIAKCSEVGVDITHRERLESDENGILELKENPSGAIFVYDYETGNKLSFERIEEKKIKIDSQYKEVIVDYTFTYYGGGRVVEIGQKLFNGFVSLEGRTKIKEDITGIVKTGIIKIPKLKIVSNLSMRLGKEANPLSGGFMAIAVPDGPRGASTFMEICLLEDDIDSDI